MEYPWYSVVNEGTLEQGDIFFQCPILLPDTSLALPITEGTISADVKLFDVIIMTQSCDLAHEGKVEEVILCPHWDANKQIDESKMKKDYPRQISRGYIPRYALLSKCEIEALPMGLRVVDFSRIFSLPKSFMQDLAANGGSRLRLLPPYREHLSQAFARFFMRVGLPQDLELP